MVNIKINEPNDDECDNKNYVNKKNDKKETTSRYSKQDALKRSIAYQSFDSNMLHTLETPVVSTKAELYSYGRKDSINRTRFLLVRTSSSQGKESYKRVTLPGGSTVEFLKFTIEKAMKSGRVSKVIMLPSKVPIERNEQISELQDSQKVEVIFGEYGKHEKPHHSPTMKSSSEKMHKLARWSSIPSDHCMTETCKTEGDDKTIKKSWNEEGNSENIIVCFSFCLPSLMEYVVAVFSERTNNTSIQLSATTTLAINEILNKRSITNNIIDLSVERFKNSSVTNFHEMKKSEINQKIAKMKENVNTIAQVVLVFVGIGGAIGIGYYIYSRSK